MLIGTTGSTFEVSNVSSFTSLTSQLGHHVSHFSAGASRLPLPSWGITSLTSHLGNQARIQGVGARAGAHPWDGDSPFEIHWSIAFKHQSIIGRPPLGEILRPPLVITSITSQMGHHGFTSLTSQLGNHNSPFTVWASQLPFHNGASHHSPRSITSLTSQNGHRTSHFTIGAPRESRLPFSEHTA